MPSGYIEEDLTKGGKKIIVTGGAGLIGRPLSEFLVSFGHEVHVLDDFSNSENNLKEPIVTHECDLTQKEKTVELITQIKPDIIYHLACHPYEGMNYLKHEYVNLLFSLLFQQLQQFQQFSI